LYAEKGKYELAADAYFKSAYEYPAHHYSREAAYAAVDTNNRRLKRSKNSNKSRIREDLILSSAKFVTKFPKDKQTPQVRVRIVEELFRLKQYDNSLIHANLILGDAKLENGSRNQKITDKQKMAVNVVVGHIAFDREDYLKAQASYQQALNIGIRKKKLRTLVSKRLAASTYKYAEKLNESGNLLAAAEGFMAVRNVSPTSKISAQAQYDAAVAYINLNEWKRAIEVLERFRRDYPGHKLQSGATDKLAMAYEKTGQYSKAATEILRIGERSGKDNVFRDATLQAALLYEKDNSRKNAISTYKAYVRNFRLPLEESLETKQKLTDLYLQSGQIQKRHYWIKNIAATKTKNKKLSDRSRYIVASASNILAEQKLRAYEKASLKLPFERSLKRKRKLMKSALLAFEKVAKLRVEEFTTASTHNIASIYQQLGVAIMNSQRPNGLSPEEREEYDLLLEEQAYPFEEKAISVYELNANRITQGIYDEWIQKSMAKLAVIQPARYAKQEVTHEMYTALD